MSKETIKYSDEYKAIEAYYVLMKRERPSRSYPRDEFQSDLARPEIYVDFLKLCLEMDNTKDLQKFRKALLIVLKAIGISEISRKTGLRREGIYRMLSINGNPEFKSMLAIFKAIGIHFWVVDKAFMNVGPTSKRFKNAIPGELPPRLDKGTLYELMK